LPLAIFFYF